MSPLATQRMLQTRYSAQAWKEWEQANERVRERQQAYDDGVIAGTVSPVYKFDHGVLGDGDVEVGAQQLTIGRHTVRLDQVSPYDDMKID